METKIDFTIEVEVMTPVFISSGNDLETFDYFYSNNKIYVLNIDECFKFIATKRKDAIDILSKWADDKAVELSSNPAKKGGRDSFKMSIFDFMKDRNYLNDINLAKELESEIIKPESKFIYYSMDSLIDPKGKKITTALKTADNCIYIPGSTLKGILRTALLKDLLFENSDKVKYLENVIKQTLQNFKGKGDHFAAKIENEIFYAGVKDRKGETKWNDEKFDIMKLIKISDSNYYLPNDACYLAKSDMFTQKSKDPQGQGPIIEAIKPGTKFSFRLSFDYNYIKNIMISTNKDQWIYFKDKFNLLFETDISNDINDKKNLKKKIMDKLNQVIKTLSCFSVNNENEWLENMEKKDVNANIKKYDVFINNLSEDELFIKLCSGEGFYGTTINETFKNTLTEVIKKLRIGKNHEKFNENSLKTFPVSRTMVNTPNGYMEKGWVKINISEA